jgi:flagellar protein FliO/FliZ
VADRAIVRRSPASLSFGLRALLLAALVALCAPPASFAEPFKKDQTPLPSGFGQSDAAATSSGGSGMGRLVLGLLVVAALVLALRWLVKRANRTRSPQSVGSLQVVATTALAQNRAVHLIRVGDELVLVGSAEQGVTPLRVYGPGEARTLEQVMGADGFVDTAGSSGGIGQLLGDIRRRTAR